jgi:PEGA domain
MRRFAVALALVLAQSPVLAQGGVEQAKMLFSAGAKAYESGQFKAAIQAFEEANRIVPKPQIVFSIAQANRRQYFLDKDPEHLRAAIKNYHAYVDTQKEGGRIADAAQALAELEPIAAKTDLSTAAPPRPTQKDPARLMVMTQVEEAQVSIDGKPIKTGMAMEVAPGKHHVSTSAQGYFPDERDVQAVASALLPVDVPLKEKPAHLTVNGAAGAQVSVDGRPVGTTPLTTPVEMPSGVHFISVTKNGYRAYSQEIDVARDERKNLAVDLGATGQRTLAYALLLGGGAAVVAGGVFTVAALKNQNDAQKILDRHDASQITPKDAESYDAARNRRDDWTKAAIVAFAAGGVTAATGLVLFFFDQPTVSVAPSRLDERPRPAPKPPPPREPMEVSFRPVLGPGYAGVAGSF